MGRRLSREARRRQILDAAIEVFARRGFRGTTTRRLASEAGVSEATIFLHFPTKRDLYRAILEEKIGSQADLRAELAAGVDRPLKETLVRIARHMLRRHRRDRSLLRLLLYSALEEHELARRFFREQMHGPFRQLVELLERAQARGEIERDVDVEMAARAFVGLILHEVLARDLFAGGLRPSLSIDRVVETYVQIYLKGVSDGGRR
jgi:AcrR family transcriptional regulator